MSQISDQLYELILKLGTKTSPIENIVTYITAKYVEERGNKPECIAEGQKYSADCLVR